MSLFPLARFRSHLWPKGPMARKGRGGTTQARSLRPQRTQASPLEVWSIPDKSGISHVPRMGCSHGDRGNLHFCDIPVMSLFRSFDPRRERRKGPETSPSEAVFLGFHPPGRVDPRKGPFPKRSSFLFGSLPGEGKRRKVGRSPEPVLLEEVREPLPSVRVDPRSHPFAMIRSPKGSCHGSWVEPWKGWMSSLESVPGDGFKEGYPSSAGPIRLVALVFPNAEAMGNLCSVRIPLRGSFPKAFP
jgi:hypothetical protein